MDAPLFRRKPRVRSFLEYTVRQTLDGQHARLKEYSIAVEVFKRPENFDPRLDSIVRVEARRLRATVDRYYETDGASDPVYIRYRRGNYIPTFESRDDRPQAPDLGMASGNGLLIGVLAADGIAEIIGRQSAALTIVAPPLTPESRDLIRSAGNRIVLLKPASPAEVELLLSPAGVSAGV